MLLALATCTPSQDITSSPRVEQKALENSEGLGSLRQSVMRLDVESLVLHSVKGDGFSEQLQAAEFRQNGDRLTGGL